MSSLVWGQKDHSSSSRLIRRCIPIALLVELCLIASLGSLQQGHPKSSKGSTSNENQFIEAQIVETRPQEHLVEDKPADSPVKKEIALSKNPQSGGESAVSASDLDEENKTQAGPKPSPNHGPMIISSPRPVLPSYFETQDINTYVLIDFFINPDGTSAPHLVRSSGNEELDSIAIEAAERWQFRPAEKDGNPYASKLRVRVNFEVK